MTKLEAIRQRDADATDRMKIFRRVMWVPEPEAEIDRRWLLGVVDQLLAFVEAEPCDSGELESCAQVWPYENERELWCKRCVTLAIVDATAPESE